MNTLEVSTVTHVSPEEAYEFLEDFPGYTEYSEYLERVDAHGDGGEGTVYDIHFSWWKLTYTTRTEVVGTDAPNEIEWEVKKDIDAHGTWHVEEIPEDAPEDAETASKVTFRVHYDESSVDDGIISLPSFISLDTVVEKVKPLVVKEGKQVVQRIVADLEGEEREIELEIEYDEIDTDDISSAASG